MKNHDFLQQDFDEYNHLKHYPLIPNRFIQNAHKLIMKGGGTMGFFGCCGYGGYGSGGYGYGNSFALIVVLFILLIIVGAAFVC
jgi:uncharacterized protein (TIGR01732 family)